MPDSKNKSPTLIWSMHRKIREDLEKLKWKGSREKTKKEQGWINPREQGAEGENVKGAWSKDPPNKASL